MVRKVKAKKKNKRNAGCGIKVAVRVRPLSKTELQTSDYITEVDESNGLITVKVRRDWPPAAHIFACHTLNPDQHILAVHFKRTHPTRIGTQWTSYTGPMSASTDSSTCLESTRRKRKCTATQRKGG